MKIVVTVYPDDDDIEQPISWARALGFEVEDCSSPDQGGASQSRATSQPLSWEARCVWSTGLTMMLKARLDPSGGAALWLDVQREAAGPNLTRDAP